MEGRLQGKELLDALVENFGEGELLKADGLDEALIGIDVRTSRLIYSCDKCVEVLMKRDGMTEGEAVEFLEFNTYSAYVGEQTPIFLDNNYF